MPDAHDHDGSSDPAWIGKVCSHRDNSSGGFRGRRWWPGSEGRTTNSMEGIPDEGNDDGTEKTKHDFRGREQ